MGAHRAPLKPDAMRAYIEEKVAAGGYSTASEYIRELVRADRKRAAQERLESLLLEGLDSESREWTDNELDELKRRVWQRHAEEGKS